MKESSEFIRVNGPIAVGKCVYTGSGNLLQQGIKYVIHTVGPQFSNDKSLLIQQMLLYDAVFNSLKTAEALECDSIAIPAISSGIYGFPPPLCAQISFSAVSDFIKQQ
jgi:O-acetyl-ADP-ribose deacetylase (regulator of RNase III)